jgi:putative endonuclease
MSYFVYIIQSTTSSKWYVGFSADLKTRINNHNAGFNVATKNRGPWELIFVREFSSKMEAIEFERYLKKTKNKAYIRRAFQQYFLDNIDGVYPDASGPVSAPR